MSRRDGWVLKLLIVASIASVLMTIEKVRADPQPPPSQAAPSQPPPSQDETCEVYVELALSARMASDAGVPIELARPPMGESIAYNMLASVTVERAYKTQIPPLDFAEAVRKVCMRKLWQM